MRASEVGVKAGAGGGDRVHPFDVETAVLCAGFSFEAGSPSV